MDVDDAKKEEEPSDLDIEADKIKGDAIGDTVYSERYVLKTLIQLSQYNEERWNEEFESDLCVLWDMTATSAVVHFLMKHDCLNLIIQILQTTSNPRLTEIMVGIIGNMCCVKEVRDVFSDNEPLCEMLVQLLVCPDVQTLVQLTRCFQSFTWDLLKGDATLSVEQHWFEKRITSGQFSSQLAFILASSLSEELLMAVLDLLNTLCGLEINDKDYSRYFATTEMITGMMECWDQLFLGCKEGSKFEFPNKQLCKSAHQWVCVLLSFAGHEAGREHLGMKAKAIVEVLFNWIQKPEDSSDDALLVSTISLLEALVSFYFCHEAFCKTIRIARKTTEKNCGSPRSSDFEDMSVLTVKESFGNYCMEVIKCVDRKTLDKILMKCCNNKSIKFFWEVVAEREPECVLSGDRSR